MICPLFLRLINSYSVFFWLFAMLDQRSIKVIERTAVPVIKVSTKDSRSRVVQLDLSFDAKEHHGLEALNMIQHILEVRQMNDLLFTSSMFFISIYNFILNTFSHSNCQ